MPGPACYDRGGTEPAVTDAQLALGRLDPQRFLGGEMTLAPQRARAALGDRIAAPLGYAGEDAVTRAAKGVLAIANLTMASIIKRISIARGYDPRDFALFCYGGGGPLHGTELARALKIPRVVVPPEPGNFSAMGMLLADPRLDTARTFIAPLDAAIMPKALAIYAALEAEGGDALRREFGDGEITFQREAEIRYKGQQHSLKIALPESGDAAELREKFDREYARRYGHANPAAEAQLVVLHSLATLHMARPELTALADRDRHAGAATPRTRPIFFLEEDCFLDAMILDRYALAPGFTGHGPALIEEYGSSTLIGPRDTFAIGKLKEIDIDCRG
jgi:N-methylhydantoinase A